TTGRALRKAQRHSDGTYYPIADGVLNEFRGGLQAQDFHKAGLVELSGTARDAQKGRDLLGRAALGDELQDLPLARRKFAQGIATGWGSAPERIDQVPGDLRGDVRSPLEGLLDGSHQLGSCRVFQ